MTLDDATRQFSTITALAAEYRRTRKKLNDPDKQVFAKYHGFALHRFIEMACDMTKIILANSYN